LPYKGHPETPSVSPWFYLRQKAVKKKKTMTPSLVIFVSLGRAVLLAVYQTRSWQRTALSWAVKKTELFPSALEFLPQNCHFTLHEPRLDPPALRKRPCCPTPGQ